MYTPVAVNVTLLPDSVCGPDITDQVIDVLRQVIKDFSSNPSKQSEACQRLIDPRTGNDAWDILELDPGTSPNAKEGDEFDPETNDWVNKKDHRHFHPWFTGVSDKCAIPRPQCAHTVEFLGICQHAQIVNYALWGVVISLCGKGYDLAGEYLRNARNSYSLTIQGGHPAAESQSNAVEVGRSIYDEIKNNPDNVDVTKLKRQFFDLTAINHRGGITEDVLACRLHCELDAATKAKFSKRQFDYNWDGLTPSSPKRGGDR